MKSRTTVFFLLLLALALGFSVSAHAAISMDALLNERLTVPDDGQAHAFVFTPTANNRYTFQSFGEGTASAQLYLEGEDDPLVEETGFLFEARLIADATYQLVVTSSGGTSEVELMRASLGRSFDQPIELGDLSAGYDKVIARAYDTHWFRFTAKVSGHYVIRSRSSINTVGYLLDESGNRLALSDNLYSPYCLDFRIQYALNAGQTYYVRVSGRGEETGAYHLKIAEPAPDQAFPQAVVLSAASLTLSEGETARLTYAVQPVGAIDDAVFLSADPSIATVNEAGEVVARKAGTTQIILSGAVGTEMRCDVTVLPIPVTGIFLGEEAATVHAGEVLDLDFEVRPEHASNRAVFYQTSDAQIISVEQNGTLAARQPGEAVITITTADGGHQAHVRVTVKRAHSRYRALIMGEQRYDDGRVRIGSINTTQGMADLFNRQQYDSGPCEVTVKLDSTRSAAIRAIRDAFEDAAPGDVSILYINCHGGLTGRVPWLEFSDGSRLTATQLQRVLSSVKGTIVLMIDCCQSGAFLSNETAVTFNQRIIQTFSAGSASRFNSTKYHVLTSASSTQQSYRFSADGTNIESAMSTVFGRSLCEAGGWDLIGDKPTRLRADLNQDAAVTLYEAYLYTARSINGFLARANVRQDVQLSPAGSSVVLYKQ